MLMSENYGMTKEVFFGEYKNIMNIALDDLISAKTQISMEGLGLSHKHNDLINNKNTKIVYDTLSGSGSESEILFSLKEAIEEVSEKLTTS